MDTGDRAAPRFCRIAAPRFAPVLLGLLLLAGCALPIPLSGGGSLVLGYSRASETRGFRQTVVPGLDVRTRGGYPGLTVGYSDLRVLTPVDASSASREAGATSIVFELPLCIRWTDASGDVRRVGLFVDRPTPTQEGCTFVHHRFLGIEGHAARGSWGAGVGSGGTSLLVLPADAECAGSLHYWSDALEKCSLELRKERRIDG